MKAKIKAIEGIYPVTTLEAVKVGNGTAKTLKDMINNGELGASGSSSGRFVTQAYLLIDDAILSRNTKTGDITVNLNKKVSLNRIMAVCYSNGTYSQIAFEDGTIIPKNKSLIWTSANGYELVDYNNLKMTNETVLVATNFAGRITAGILRHIWDKYYPYLNTPLFNDVRNVRMNEIAKPAHRTLHSMVVIDNELVTLECYNGNDFNGASHVYSLPDLQYQSTFTLQLVGKRNDGEYEGKINLRLVTADYNQELECLVLGSGTADGSDSNHLEGYIFYDAKNWKNKTTPITFENTPHTVIDFHSDNLFPNQTTAKIVWSELPDILYLTTSNLKYCHKILLGVGTTKLEYGQYNYDSTKRYNGTFKILKTYSQEESEFGNKDTQFYDGHLYYTAKDTTGGYKLYKTKLTPKGGMEHDLIFFNPVDSTGTSRITGSPEGVVITKDGLFIGAHAVYGYFYTYPLK